MVAEGAPSELTGGAGVEVETSAGAKTYPDVGRDEVPDLVARLVAEGERVYGVRQVSSTLEDFYIETVSDEEAG